jgi:hypothetical protein
VVAELERLGVTYYIGGSLASSFYGRPRTTVDADMVADLAPQHVAPLVEALRSEYYVSETAVRHAVARKSCFNAIHLATMFKVDVFAIKDRTYDRAALARIRSDAVELERPEIQFAVASAKDTVLSGLEWFRPTDPAILLQYQSSAPLHLHLATTGVKRNVTKIEKGYPTQGCVVLA